MSTHSIITITDRNNNLKAAVYSFSDGYLDGVGLTILHDIKKMNFQTFEKNLNKVKFTDKKELVDLAIEEYFGEYLEYYTQKFSLGWCIVDAIEKTNLNSFYIEDETCYTDDCQYEYHIDFNKMTFYVVTKKFDVDHTMKIDRTKEYSLFNLPSDEDFVKLI